MLLIFLAPFFFIMLFIYFYISRTDIEMDAVLYSFFCFFYLNMLVSEQTVCVDVMCSLTLNIRSAVVSLMVNSVVFVLVLCDAEDGA